MITYWRVLNQSSYLITILNRLLWNLSWHFQLCKIAHWWYKENNVIAHKFRFLNNKWHLENIGKIFQLNNKTTFYILWTRHHKKTSNSTKRMNNDNNVGWFPMIYEAPALFILLVGGWLPFANDGWSYKYISQNITSYNKFVQIHTNLQYLQDE